MAEAKAVVLILDDEPMVTATIRNHLALEGGYETVVFHNPAEALDYLRSHPVDVIISDQVMPEMSGLEFFERVREIQAEATRVLLTGYAQKEDVIRAINRIGLFQFVEKPWSNAELMLVIRNGLERKKLYESLQRKIGELAIASGEIERLRDGLVELYLEKSTKPAAEGAAAGTAQTRRELRRIVGSEVRRGVRRFVYAFAAVAVLLVASVSYIVYRSFFTIRRETAGLKLQIGEIRSRQLNPVEIERLRQAAVAPVSRSEASEQVIARYEGSVCLIQGSYVFLDRETGRLLRLRMGPEAQPRVDSSGNVDLTLEGDGPPLENFHTGTGFLVAADGKILTNRHVAQPWWADAQAQKVVAAGYRPQYRQFAAYFPYRRRVFGLKALKVSDQADLALLQTATSEDLPKPIPLETESKGTSPGAPVLLIHYPLGLEALVAKASQKELERIPNLANLGQEQLLGELAGHSLILPFITQGHISNVTEELLVYDAVTTVGGSGGPLFNLAGKVIAVNFAVLTQFTGASMGVPIRYALELLRN